MLELLTNKDGVEVHYVNFTRESFSIISHATGAEINAVDFEEIFPGFINIATSASNYSTSELIGELSQLNRDYIWAHVSGGL